MLSLEFLLTSLVVVLIPGAGVIYTVSTALIHGRRAGVIAALGCTAGIVPHLLGRPSWAWLRCCMPAPWPSRG